MVNENPDDKDIWSPRVVEGWYICPAIYHYRCYTVWIKMTRDERIDDTIAWLLSSLAMPIPSSVDCAIDTAQDITISLANTSSASLLASIINTNYNDI